MSTQTSNVEPKGQRRDLVATALLILLLLALIKGALLGRHVYALARHAMRLTKLAANPASVLSAQVPPQVVADLGGVEVALRGLRAELGLVLRPVWLPWRAARDNLRALDELLRVGAELAHAGQVASGGLQGMAEAMERRGTSGGEAKAMSELLFEGLLAASPHLQKAAGPVGQAAADVAALPATRLWGPLPRLVPMLQYYLELGHAGLEAAAAAPTLLGAEEPAHYLLLAQNNDEIRATGGFITGIGVATVTRGNPGKLTIRDSYDFDKFTVDHPYAPEAMQRHMGIILWVTRDGNWSPDFPTAAQAVEDLYHLENTTEIEGMVAFDMQGLQALVEAVGPLYIEEYQDQIDGANVLQKAREYWAPTVPGGLSLHEWLDEQGWDQVKEDWWAHRKDFMGLLAEALMAKLQAGTQADQLMGLLWTVKRAIDEKHILLYFHDPAVQGLLAKADMDGALDSGADGDYLLALDTNMGYNKVNLNVEKIMDYQVSLADKAVPQATLTITYHNRSPAQPICEHRPKIAETYDLMAKDCYWNYLRVYVPLGSELLWGEGVTQTETIAEEHGRTLFTTFMVVPAAESHTVSFTYRLPAIQGDEYRLLVQKQPGTDAVPLTVRVHLPDQISVVATEPGAREEQPSVVAWDLHLRRDRSVRIEWR